MGELHPHQILKLNFAIFNHDNVFNQQRKDQITNRPASVLNPEAKNVWYSMIDHNADHAC